jgi:integrase/recombinase XerD
MPTKSTRYPVEILTPEEAAGIIRACSRRAPTGIRNAALFTVLYRGGLRIGEALALYPKDVDQRAGKITVLHGKGDRRRDAALDAGAFAIVQRWIDRRAELGFNGRQPIFCTISSNSRGQALDDAYVRRALRAAAARAGIEKRVHPHGLRHTYAAELMAEGHRANVIQQQLGHSSLATTDVYLRHIAPVDRIELLRQREWTL